MAILSFKWHSAKQLSDVVVAGKNISIRRGPVKKAPRSKRKFEELKGHDHEKKETNVARPRLTIRLRPKFTIKLQPDVVRRALHRVRKQPRPRNGDIGETEIDDLEDAKDSSVPPAKKLKIEEVAAGLGDPAPALENTVPASTEQPRRWASTQQELDESNARWIALNSNNTPWTDPDAMGPNEGKPVQGPVEEQEPESEVKECKCGEVETCDKCRAFAEELHKHFQEWNAEVGWTWT
ncbi:hypothetical protein EWM64_g6812 [Hericium alpestre]|uniref:Uncharacterized protein n=1 Tax=Hericium alpestre TaxID=135208 RepID=A0A4Y9ZSI5_9AGAM|nr:hypothetical protein EWM64_g6812 [Hericium alpestre]